MANTASMPRVGYIGSKGMVTPATGRYFQIENPATGRPIAEVYEIDGDDLDEIVQGAEQAYQTTWRHTSPEFRGGLLRKWAELVVRDREALADVEVEDVGHLRRETLGDIDGCVRNLTYYAGLADKIEGSSYAQLPGRLAYGIQEPYGVVAGVSPYNANPVFVALKAAPALVAGNCIVLKAPELSPLSSFRLVELALEAGIPPGVVNLVTGRGQVVGPLLTEHPGIGMVAFTGGTDAGRAVIRQSATNIVPIALELGGKNPIIVLDDADLGTIVPFLLHSNFVKSGQSCAAGTRIFVSASRHDELTDRMAALTSKIRVGLPGDEQSQLGTLISKAHRGRVHDLVTRAVAQGATVLTGGEPAEDGELSQGAFYKPTILTGVSDDNPIATTEAFGPVASVLSYSGVDEVLHRANNSEFGLSAQVWGNNARDIQFLAAHLTVGTVWVNTYRAIHPTVPFGGMKSSGYGRENAFEAIRMYTRSKSVVWDLTTDRTPPYA